MIVIDTNVLSELMRPSPDPRVVAWMSTVAPGEAVTTSVTIAEIGHGLRRLPRGKRRARLEDAFEAREHPDPLFWQAEVLKRQGRRRVGRAKLDYLYERWGAPRHLEVACAKLYNELRD